MKNGIWTFKRPEPRTPWVPGEGKLHRVWSTSWCSPCRPAAQKFCRVEFALKHRYAMALHTDEPHPHVHVVLKAVSEQGRRLNIKKVTLQEWRAKFAAHLREQGVAANATPRRFRDQPVRATPHALLRQRAREQLAGPPRREKGLLLPGAPPLRVKDREPYTKT
jgi:thiol-disulfide isomerase/thioredoxin